MCDHIGQALCGLLIVFFLLTATLSQNAPSIQPIAYTLPAPPVLMGPMESNSVLKDAERVHQNVVKGPTSFVSFQDHLFASTVDSKIYEMARCPPRLIANLAPPGCVGKYQCGQLTSLRLYPANGHLLALDTFRGLFIVHPISGHVGVVVNEQEHRLAGSPPLAVRLLDYHHTRNYRLLYSANTPVNGRRPVHLNDMVVMSNGVVIMSDSSDTYNIDNDIYVCMDGRPTGRLLAFDPRTGRVTELLPGRFNFPNGLELTPDGDLLVGETCRATIHRVSMKRNSWLRVEPFSVNLPGLPDNIRASGRGTYWVAMSYARHSGISNPLDQHSRNPRHRGLGFKYVTMQELKNLFTKWGLVVELDAAGAVIGSLHDPTGNTLSMVTEVNEFGGVLNIGSHIANYMARFMLPVESGIKTSVDSFLQVKRSRCELPDSKFAEVRRQLLQQEQAKLAPTRQTTKPKL